MKELNRKEERELVSKLIYSVLTDRLDVKAALLRFPSDSNDESVKTAYHALIHREADEDLRAKDLLYKDEQDEYLEFIAEILQKGNELPDNIIKGYNSYHKGITPPNSKTFKGFIKGLCKFLNV